jgi:hypothetical protein
VPRATEELKARAAERREACPILPTAPWAQPNTYNSEASARGEAEADLDLAIAIAEAAEERDFVSRHRVRVLEQELKDDAVRIQEVVDDRDEARAAVLALRDACKLMGSDGGTHALTDTESYEQYRTSDTFQEDRMV